MFQKSLKTVIQQLSKIRPASKTANLSGEDWSVQGFEALWQEIPNVAVARRNFEMALSLNPSLVGAHAGLACTIQYEQQPETALEHARNIKAGYSLDWQSSATRALVLDDVGRLSEDNVPLKQLSKLTGGALALVRNDVADYLVAQGFDFLWQGASNIDTSGCYFEMALFMNPDHILAHAGLARIMRYYRQPEVALQYAEKAEAGNPQDWYNLKVKALILRDLGRLPEAIETLKLVASLEPVGSDRTLTELTVQILTAAVEGKYDDGLHAIISALPKLDADSWEPYRFGWWLLKHKGDQRASQLVAVGRFVLGVGKEFFHKNDKIISVSELAKAGAIIDDRILPLNDSCEPIIDTSALNRHLPRWELLDQRNARITIIKEASCVSSKFGTAVLVGGRLVEELAQNDALMILARGVPEPYVVEKSVLNVSFPWGEGFFHFIMEVLPSIGVAHEVLGAPAIDKYLLRTKAPYQLEILAQLGIYEDKLIFSDQFPSVLATELITITNLAPHPPFYEAQQWSCRYLRRTFSHLGQQENPNSKRVFISRGSGTNGRTVLNENQISTILKNNKFDTIYPEKLNFSDQVSLYQGADIIIAPAGGALVNLVFCKPGTKVLVLFQPHSTWRVYQSIAEIVGLEMYLLFGNEVGTVSNSDPDWMKIDDNVDFEVNLSKFEKILASMVKHE